MTTQVKTAIIIGQIAIIVQMPRMGGVALPGDAWAHPMALAASVQKMLREPYLEIAPS